MVHTESGGMLSKLCDTVPARLPARITKFGNTAMPLQTTWIVTASRVARERTGDGLGDQEGAGEDAADGDGGGWAVAVSDVCGAGAAGRNHAGMPGCQ